MDLTREIFKRAKKNVENKDYYPNENCSNLTKNFIHIMVTEYSIKTWSELFEFIKFTVDPKKTAIENLECFLLKYKNNILDNE